MRLQTLPLLGILAGMLASSAVAAEPVSVKVTLWSKGSSMGIALDKNRIPSGPVEFDIKNSSTNLKHEFLIAPWKGAPSALPYDDASSQVAEDKVPGLQGQEDMPPQLETTMRLVLQPGLYVVFCNQPGHYKMGMYARLDVGGSS